MILEGYPYSLGTTTLLQCSAEQELKINKECWKRRPGNEVAAWESAMMEQGHKVRLHRNKMRPSKPFCVRIRNSV